MTPGDDSPGDGPGSLFTETLFALATPVCLVPAVLRLGRPVPRGQGRAFLATARVAAALLVILAC